MISRLVGLLLRAHLGWSLRGGTTSVAWTRRSLAQYRTLTRWFERAVEADTRRILRRRAAWAALRAWWRGTPIVAPVESRCAYVLPLIVALAATPRHVWRLCQRGVGTCRAGWWLGRRVTMGNPSEAWRVALQWALLGLVVLWTLGHPGTAAASPVLLGTTYYVSPYGSDSNNGLGPDASAASNKPWLTIGQALGASGIASGDTVYLAPGIYRESVTVAMTSATVTTLVAGDPANAQGFADANGGRLSGGPIVWTNFTPTDMVTPPSSTALDLSGRDFLTFKNLHWITGTNSAIAATTTTSTDITIQACAMYCTRPTGNALSLTVGAGVAANWTLDGVTLRGTPRNQVGGGISITLTRHSADYDANIVIKTVKILAPLGVGVRVASTGAGAGFGGGVDVLNATISGSDTGVFTADANLATAIPCTVSNSYIETGATALNATTSGQITEDYNVLNTPTARTNVTTGVHSTTIGAQYGAIGQEVLAGMRARSWWEPLRGFNVLSGFGGASVPATDLLGLPRPCGTMMLLTSGTASAGAAKTITDSTKSFAVNGFAGAVVKITGGTGSGQVKHIASNTATVITVDGNWNTNPSTDSTYVVYLGAMASSGKATAGAATTLTDSNAAWPTNAWTGFTLAIVAGTGNGQTKTIASNTGTVITVSTWGTNPDNTSQYKIYRGTDENTVNAACGCFERGNTMTKDTATVRTGSASLRAFGPAVQDFELPVDAVATTVTVYVQYDSTYAGTLPQITVLNGDECGVSDATATAVGGANTWEQLTLSFTPARAGIVTIRLQSNCTATLGSAYFDDFELTPRTTPNGFDHYRRGEPVASLGSLLGLARVA